MDYGKEGGKDSGSNRDEDVEENTNVRGVTLKDREKSENIRKELGVDDLNEKVREIRMIWYGM